MRAYLTERLRLEVGDRVVDQASLPGNQGRLALAFLLVEHRRPVARDELADVLWAGAPPSSWEKGLAVVVSKLRAVLAEGGLGDGALTYASGCYELHLPTDAWIDVEAAEGAAELAETARANDDAAEALRSAAAAAEIARRRFLPGDEGLWVEARREALAVVLRRALECASAAALSLGDAVAATAAAREAVALEPYREQTYLHLIRAQAADGNRADALRTYERCRRLLSEELGVTPSPQTEEAYLALLGAETSAPPAPDSVSAHASSGAGAKVRYAKADDVYIAYQVFGGTGPDLLLFSGGMLPIDSMDEEPSLARFHARLASSRRLIRFDLRGVGLSDSVATSSPPTLEQWMHDALAVMDDAGSRRATVFAPRDAALEGILLAATHPDRVARLIIVNGTARIARHDDYPVGVPKRVLDQFLELNFEPDAMERGYDSLEFFAPSVARDEAFREWWTRAGNRGAGPATAKLLDRVRFGADVRALLPLVRVPTLVLHRRDNAALGVGHGRYLAEHLPNATYVELPGADDLYWVGDTRLMLDEIEQFLSGDTRDRETGGVLTTVVCADIMGLSAVGEIRERCDAAVSRQLRRFQGREIRTSNHDVMATFDGPARAVSCARCIRDAVVDLGLPVRIGVHIGAVAADADDDDGVAFELAAQVAAVAQPGEILVSRTVVDVIVGSGIETASRGEHVLTSASGSWHLFAVSD